MLMASRHTRLRDSIGMVIKALEPNLPMTTNQIAERTELNWATAKRVLGIIMEIQEFLAANEVIVIGGKPRKLVIVQIRVELSKLPSDVIDWFIGSSYFTMPKENLTTEEVRAKVVPLESTGKTSIEDAIMRVVSALKLEDELSVLELSKRSGLNRRTTERVLDLFIQYQDVIARYRVVEIDDMILRELRSTIYDLDSSRMKFLLKKRYLPDQAVAIPEERERELLKLG